jgi:hypothetical protein
MPSPSIRNETYYRSKSDLSCWQKCLKSKRLKSQCPSRLTIKTKLSRMSEVNWAESLNSLEN